MCKPITCPRCGKTTWQGCGQHVEAVRASVPPEEWCGHDLNEPERRN